MYSSARNDSIAFASSTFSPRTAHEEATVEGVMNRWRVRPIYDNYSATVAPSAPDTMSIFLSLRAELLKSSLNLEQAAQQQNKASSSSSSSDDDDSDSGEGGKNADGGSSGGGMTMLDHNDPLTSYLSAKAAAKKKRKDKRKQQKKDDYTVRHLKGELARLLEQLQVSNAETIQLKNQIAGMTKELSTRQRKITDLEESNRGLRDQNQQLQQTVAELGLTLSAVEENNHQQINMAASGAFTLGTRARTQSMANFPPPNRLGSTMEGASGMERARSVHFNKPKAEEHH